MIAVREAVTTDLDGIAELIAELGFAIPEDVLESNLTALTEQGAVPLVADGGKLIGCITYNTMSVLHRPTPVGRISMLVVTSAWRGRGVGRSLVEAVTARLRVSGCGLCEVTSNVALADAHLFYERLGFQRTSLRLVKPI